MPIASSTTPARLVAAAAAIAAGIALAACSSQAAPAPAPGVSAPASSDAAAPGAEETAAPAEPRVGELVSVDGWDFTVVSVGAPQESVGAAPFGNAAQGVYLPVVVTITNTSTEAQFLSSDAVALLDAAGSQFSADSVASIYDESAIQLGELNPGITLTGPVYFDVPDGTAPTAVTFTGGLFGGETVTVTL